jgi:hypothetical protein
VYVQDAEADNITIKNISLLQKGRYFKVLVTLKNIMKEENCTNFGREHTI